MYGIFLLIKQISEQSIFGSHKYFLLTLQDFLVYVQMSTQKSPCLTALGVLDRH